MGWKQIQKNEQSVHECWDPESRGVNVCSITFGATRLLSVGAVHLSVTYCLHHAFIPFTMRVYPSLFPRLLFPIGSHSPSANMILTNMILLLLCIQLCLHFISIVLYNDSIYISSGTVVFRCSFRRVVCILTQGAPTASYAPEANFAARTECVPPS